MNILFLSLLDFASIEEHSIYTDLLREFVRRGNTVYAVSPIERRKGQKTHIVNEEGTTILKLQIGNTQKTNIIEKGISTVLIEPQFIHAIKKYFSKVKFDLVLYSTPPITFCKAVKYVKRRDRAKSYLMLKDIFPQNAVDIGMLKITGIKGILYRYFRGKEKKLYAISDKIGCMSPANVKYILEHNPELNSQKVEVCPNCIEPIDKSVDETTRERIREKYGIPLNKTVFVYGGNLGKPQGIPFLIECLKSQENNHQAFFLIVGDGTEYTVIESYIQQNRPGNVLLLRRLPKDDYDTLVGACDVGMIFLDCRFTIPNFPSRLLSYTQAKIPILTVTDKSTDIGTIVEKNEFGYSVNSGDLLDFNEKIKIILNADDELKHARGNIGYSFMLEHYSVELQATKILRTIENK